MSDYTTLGAISAGAGVLSSLISSGSNARANETNLQIAREYNAAQRELAEFQANYNERMWHMQNEYNTPSAQMERFRAAGLNPNLVYSQGNPGNAASSPTYPDVKQMAASVKPVVQDGLGLANALNNVLQVKALELENRRREQALELFPYQQQLAQLKVFNEGVNQTLKQQQVTRNSKQLAVLDKQLQLQVQASEQTMRNIIARGDLLIQQKELNIEANARAWRAMDQRDRSIAINAFLAQIKSAVATKQLTLTDQQIKNLSWQMKHEAIKTGIDSVNYIFERNLGSKNASLASKLFLGILKLVK